ncbi:MAG TPA: hypothetical protein PLE22_07840 [Acidovorax sp.]|jgi:hypothetical protein|nr:hypothetical protein [Acidovorax sp.]
MRQTTLNNAQHAVLLQEIAHNAFQMAELASRIGDRSGDPVDVEVLTAALEIMARRVGWMADYAHAGLSGVASGIDPDAVHWLMPAHFAAEAVPVGLEGGAV